MHRRSTAAEHAEQVAGLVRASGAHLGAVIDPDGERLTLIDDEGHVLDRHRGPAGASSTLVAGHLLGDTVALPVNVTAAGRAIVAPSTACGSRATKLSTPALMDAATEPGVGFAASTDGGYILPGFLPAFDAAAALVKMLELLARSGTRAVDGRRRLPRCTSPTRRSSRRGSRRAW